MNMILADIEDVLFDGTPEQMNAMASDVSYVYYPKTNSFELAVGKLHAKMHKLPYTPNCVEHFGNKHTFS